MTSTHGNQPRWRATTKVSIAAPDHIGSDDGKVSGGSQAACQRFRADRKSVDAPGVTLRHSNDVMQLRSHVVGNVKSRPRVTLGMFDCGADKNIKRRDERGRASPEKAPQFGV